MNIVFNLLSLGILLLANTLSCLSQNENIIIAFSKDSFLYTTINPLIEVRDKSIFEIPFDKDKCAIGFLTLSDAHELYKNRNNSAADKKEFEELLKNYNIDSSSFEINNLKNTRLYVCVFMDNGVKNIIVDTDFDKSFIDEKTHEVNLDNGFTKGAENPVFVYSDVKLQYDSLGINRIKILPLAVLSNYADHSESFGNNDSLQVYISPAFSYKGEFTYNGNTVEIWIECQNFDQFYNKDWLSGDYSVNNSYRNHFNIETVLRVGYSRFKIADVDLNKKIMMLQLDGVDSVGIEKGCAFQRLPGVEFGRQNSLVFFTSSTCAPCKTVLNNLKSFHVTFSHLNIININSEKDSLTCTKYISDNLIDWRVIYDNSKSRLYFDRYNIISIPVLFYVDKNGIILDHAVGESDCMRLLETIEISLKK